MDEGDQDTPFDWWYLTSHFITENGEKFSYTVVYISNGPNCCIRQTSIMNDAKKTFFWELMKGSLASQKGVLNLTYSNSNGDRDRWCQKKDELFSYVLSTSISKRLQLDVTLKTNKPPLVHNDGIIQMGRGGDSFYYSLTNLTLSGTFMHEGVTEKVHGLAWIDRQWGSWDNAGYDGWEWFALQLNDNTEIMLYVFYDFLREKRISHALSIMFNDGTSIDLNNPEMFSLTNLAYRQVRARNFVKMDNFLNFSRYYFSSGWRLLIPGYDVDLIIKPIIENQRIGYSSWEGSCHVTGKHNGVDINSISTVELTHLYVYPLPIRCIKNMSLKFFRKLQTIRL